MDANRVTIVIYVVVSLVTIGVLLYFLIRCENKNCDGFCVCSHGSGTRKQVCQSREQTRAAYDAGLTEYSDFAGMQKAAGGPKWSNISPGDYNFPQNAKNCDM